MEDKRETIANGIFGRKLSKLSIMSDITGIVAGIFLILMTLFFIIVDSDITSDTAFELAFLAFIGLIVIISCIVSLLFNRGAYFYLSDDGVSARFSWTAKLKCSYAEIAFCEYGINTLTIRLKNGKKYLVANILNAADICREIRRKITVPDENTCSPAELNDEVNTIRKQRTKWMVFTLLFFSMMFLAIFVTDFLTDGKEMSDFSRNDWTVFLFFCIFELIDLMVAFFFANKCGKLNLVLSEKRTALKKLILKTAPLPSGNLLQAYIDADYTARVTIFGYPNMNDVYFIVQTVDKKFNIITTYSSEIYANMEELQPMLDELIQIA